MPLGRNGLFTVFSSRQRLSTCCVASELSLEFWLMDALSQLIEQENEKLRLLEAEAAGIRKRIQTLKDMQAGSDLDAFFAGKIAAPRTPWRAVPPDAARPVAAAAPQSPDAAPKQRRKGEVKRALLGVLDRTKAKHLKELIQAMAVVGYVIDNKRMRAEMWTYKNDGLVESDQPGYYRLSEQGAAFLERQKGESPGATGLSDATKSREDDLA